MIEASDRVKRNRNSGKHFVNPKKAGDSHDGLYLVQFRQIMG